MIQREQTQHEQTRAREPDVTGVVERDGVALAYEVFGEGDTTVLLMPTWSIVHSRVWKAQVAYLARHYRVLTFDGRGCGRSGRPVGRGGVHERAVRRRHHRGDGRHRHHAKPCWSRCRAARRTRCTSRPTTPTG